MTYLPIIVALAGRSGSGKSTAARYLAEKYDAKVYTFARPLKPFAKHVFELSHEQVYGSQAAKEAVDPRYGKSARDIVNSIGDALRETFDEDILLRKCMIDIATDFDRTGHHLYVIDDCRLTNEAAFVFDGEFYNHDTFSGYVVKLECPDAPPSPSRGHHTEASVDEIPEHHLYATVVSRRSDGDLASKLDAVLVHVLGKRAA